MISTRTMTLIFMAVTLLAVIVYDTLVAINKFDGDTISEITLAWAMKYPISVFCVGMALGTVIGHLLWYQIPPGYVKLEP